MSVNIFFEQGPFEFGVDNSITFINCTFSRTISRDRNQDHSCSYVHSDDHYVYLNKENAGAIKENYLK